MAVWLLCACFPAPADEFSALWREAEQAAGVPILVPGNRQLPVSSKHVEFDPVSPRDRAAADELDAWQTLNPVGFRYTSRRAPFRIPLEHPSPGALTAYAMRSAAEDRAEVAAALFMDGTRASFHRIIAADPAVRRKAEAIMRKLQAIDASMSRTYFRALLGSDWN